MIEIVERADRALADMLLSTPTLALMAAARVRRDEGHGDIQTYSPKIFIPLTQLCRNYCHYCTFARQGDKGQPAYLSPTDVLAIAERGKAAGCTEALFTLGDKPERRYARARADLAMLGRVSTIDYLAEVCELVVRRTGLLPHVNAGVLDADELSVLRKVSASQGLMLESTAERLCAPGGPHHRSPDKAPAARLETLRIAGELAIPFTSGILIGIGETRIERLHALFQLRDINRRYGHIQEIIVQNFRAKPRTPMANAAEPELEDLQWSIAAARLIFDAGMNIQAPPNLSRDDFPRLMDAGINDWGGVSPVTPDHVNPEAAWPEATVLRRATEASGRQLIARLPIYPAFARSPGQWLDDDIAVAVRRLSDADGYPREDRWIAGDAAAPPPAAPTRAQHASAKVRRTIDRVVGAASPDEADVVSLFGARDADLEYVCASADALRRAVCGEEVGYVVNRNINYTNICLYKCSFCAFSKGSMAENLRGPAYDLSEDEVIRRTLEAQARGATEVCLQGGIHPDYTGEKYLSLCRTIKSAAPCMHIHAFSPLEIAHGAATLAVPVSAFVRELKAAGLGSLPGTAAEILDDDIRRIICPDKLTTAEWLEVVEAAHKEGLQSTSTIMFGHVETARDWARHLLHIRTLQIRTGGITEFVPLPFVHMAAPMGLQGVARRGPTFREVRLMHAIARLTLHPHINNIQTSWVKLGVDGARICLNGGANDLGGTLMNESISRAAGSTHGQEMTPGDMDAFIRSIGRDPYQRTTLYGRAPGEQVARTRAPAPLAPLEQTPPRRRHKVTLSQNGTH